MLENASCRRTSLARTARCAVNRSVVAGFAEAVNPTCKVPTMAEYAELVRRRGADEIGFYFDSAQCRDFLLRLDHDKFRSLTEISLQTPCTVIRVITYALEPGALLVAIIASFFWLGWFGLLAAPITCAFWAWLKATSCVGRLHIARHVALFALGIAAAVWFRSQGTGFVAFAVSLATLYLGVKMLYALPVLVFSRLSTRCYEVVRFAYGHSSDVVTQGPMMWHKSAKAGKVPPPEIELPTPSVMFASHWIRRPIRALKEKLRGRK